MIAARVRTASLFLLLSPLALGCSTEATPTGSAKASAKPPTTRALAPLDSLPAKSSDRTFDDIRFEIEPGDPYDRSQLTEEIQQLDGRPIRIRGYILPTARKRGLEQFVLVRDNQECCFGPGAALYDCILVEMPPGKGAEFTIRPVTVEGQFQLSEFPGPDGTPLAIYKILGESAR